MFDGRFPRHRAPAWARAAAGAVSEPHSLAVAARPYRSAGGGMSKKPTKTPRYYLGTILTRGRNKKNPRFNVFFHVFLPQAIYFPRLFQNL